MTMNDKTYDLLKWIAQYVLPGLGTLYFALASIWGLPYGEQVVGTITAIDAFLGLTLGLSGRSYNKTTPANAQETLTESGIEVKSDNKQ